MSDSASGLVFLLILPFLLLMHAVFVLVSSTLRTARIKKIIADDFNVNFGKQSAVKLLQSASINTLSAQAWRFFFFFLMAFVLLEVFQGNVLGSFFPNSEISNISFGLILVVICLVAALVLVQIAWAVSYAVPERSLCLIAPFITPLIYIFYPLAYLADLLGGMFSGKFSLENPVESQQSVTMEDIVELVDFSDNTEESQDELAMLKGVVDLSETEVDQVMTPRQDIVSISLNNTVEDILKEVVDSEYSRILVIGENLDQVKGFLLVRELVPLLGQEVNVAKIAKLIRPVLFIPGSLDLLELLTKFRTEKAHIAVVVDEHGGVDGIITMEDVLEEIVGDIFDESDYEEEPDFKQTLSGDLIVDGGALVDDLNEEYDLKLPEGEYDTIAGFIIHQLGKIPNQGEVLVYNGFKLIIEGLADNRINQVRVIVS